MWYGVSNSEGGNRTNVSPLTWYHWLGHCLFKTVDDFTCSGVSGIVITDFPTNIPGLDTCAACIAAKLVHLPHKVSRTHTTEFLECVHIDIAGLMPTHSAGGCKYLYVHVDDCTHVVWMHALHHKSNMFKAFKTFKAAAKKESGSTTSSLQTQQVAAAGQIANSRLLPAPTLPPSPALD